MKGKSRRGIKTYRILAIDGIPGDIGTEGYMDDGSDSYKRFAVDTSGELHILAEYPKSRYGNEYIFSQIMGKFDPYVFFLKEPVEVESMDLDILLNVYWNNYGG